MTTRLKQARVDRGWSQARLIGELRSVASRHGVALPGAESLRGQLSRWENGHVQPDDEYRRLLRLVYGLDDDGLGFNTSGAPMPTPASEELQNRLASAAAIDGELLRLLDEQTDTMRRLDRRLGAPALLEQMRAHISQVETLLAHAVLDRERQPLAAVLADAAALAGWQALDVGDQAQAWRFHEIARRVSRESGSPCLQAHAMGEQAFVLLDLDRPAQAVDLLTEAQTLAPLFPVQMRSWLHAASAEARAAAGDAAGARCELAAAERTLPNQDDMQSTPYLSLDEVHLARWRGHTLTRLRDPAAVQVLTEALEQLDPSFTRAEAALRCDLAAALLHDENRDEAVVQARAAQALAAQTGSVRQRRRLDALMTAA